jgi:hypothetical protein
MACLFRIQISEQFIGGLKESCVRKIPFDDCRTSAENFDNCLILFRKRKRVE